MIKTWLKSISRKLSGPAPRRRKQRNLASAAVIIECLESRQLLSAASVVSDATAVSDAVFPSVTGTTSTILTAGTTAQSLTPAHLQTAYGVNSLISAGTDGTGETIAIIDPYNDPQIAADVNSFSTYYGLTLFGGTGPTLTIENQAGSTSTSTLPGIDNGTDGQSWRGETRLDIEYAHAMAPKANIILVEANSNSAADLFAAVNTARNTANVNVVSMSFSFNEFNGETQYDSVFTTPAGHTGGGITFIASTGDDVTTGYPALSPNVVAVGGTALTLNGSSAWSSETYWYNSLVPAGGGQGVSLDEPQNATQLLTGISGSGRTVADVSMDAQPGQNVDDFVNGVAVYNSYDGGSSSPWYPGTGGTSLSAPMFAGIVALADQQRGSGNSLDGATQTLPALYQTYAGANYSTNFHDITSGGPAGGTAGTNYDEATGIGSPKANSLVPTLDAYAPSLSFTGMETSTLNYTAGGAAITLTNATAISDSNNIKQAVVGLPDYQSGDSITYTLPGGITASTVHTAGYNTYQVVFSGTASAATYQTLLRSVKFSTSSVQVNSTSRRIDFSVLDTANASSTQSRYVTLLNSAPVITGLGGTSNTQVYLENTQALPIGADSTYAVTITDSDSVYMKGARVVIAANYISGDLLSFTAPAGSGITGSWSSGTLTLTGNATIAAYEQALSSVTFNNVFQTASALIRRFEFYVTDSSGDASAFNTSQSYDYATTTGETTTPSISENNSAYTYFTQGGSPVNVTAAADLSIAAGSASSNIVSATAQITANYVAGSDFLQYSGTSLTSNWDPTTATLTLTSGTGLSPSAFATELAKIQFGNNSDNPNNSTNNVVRPITFQISDGWGKSYVALANSIKDVYVTPLSSTPALALAGTTSYSLSGNNISHPITLINAAGTNTLTDTDSKDLASMTVTIGGYQLGDSFELSATLPTGINAVFSYGKLTLYGDATLADYLTALKKVEFFTTAGGSSRTFSVQAIDDTGAASASNVVTWTLSIGP